MARENKGTRIKGLPPKLQLQQKDATTGSFPSKVRIASDNRSGEYEVNYNDLNTIAFTDYQKKDLSFIDDVIAYYSFEDPDIVGETDTVRYFKSKITTSASFGDLAMALSSSSETGKKEDHVKESPFTAVFSTSEKSLFLNKSTIAPNYSKGVITGSNIEAFNRASPHRPYSIAAWIRPHENQVGQVSILEKKASDIQYSFRIGGGSFPVKIDLIMEDPGTGLLWVETSSGHIQQDKWHHVAATYDASGTPSGMRLYVDGKEVGTTTRKNNFTEPDNNNGPVEIDNIGGNVDEVVFVDRVLTADEIEELYNHRETLTTPKEGVGYGVGLNVGSKFLTSKEQGTNIVVDGRVVKGIGDTQASFTPGQSLEPFHDEGNVASDALSNISGTNYDFYATGSKTEHAGPGFEQPLWSKSKIEIDMGVNAKTTMPLVLSGGVETSPGEYPSVSDLGQSYPMCYYNFDTKTWEGIGVGAPHGLVESNALTDPFSGETSTVFRAFHRDVTTLGFTPSILMDFDVNFPSSISGAFTYQAAAGMPFTNLGFPYHPKFHATSSQTLDMSQFISKPFLVEKIYVEMSAAYQITTENFTTGVIRDAYTENELVSDEPAEHPSNMLEAVVPAAINNFFIMNQRENFPLSHEEDTESDTGVIPLQTNTPTEVTLSFGANPTRVNSIRDLITWGGISSFANNIPTSSKGHSSGRISLGLSSFVDNPKEIMTRDAVFQSPNDAIEDLGPVSWTGSFALELTTRHAKLFDKVNPGAKRPSQRGFMTFMAEGDDDDKDSPGFITSLKRTGGSRNGMSLSSPSGRDLRSSFAVLDNNNVKDTGGATYRFVRNRNTYAVNPYVLKPTDKLVFGWQQPILNYSLPTTVDSTNQPRTAKPGQFSEVTFPVGPARIILYGSEIENSKEKHDTLNQLLTNEAVHEVIGDD